MSEQVGQRVRAFREKKNLSLDDLARATGLAAGFLAAVEDGLYPSLGPLVKIARGLGLRLGTFLDDRVSADPLIVRLAEREEEIVTHKGKDKPADLKFYSLGRGKSDRHLEPFYIEILPESAQDKKLSAHEGEEFIVVLSGQVELIYGQDKTVLGQGDSAHYNSVVPHCVSWAGGDKAEIYAVLYFPE